MRGIKVGCGRGWANMVQIQISYNLNKMQKLNIQTQYTYCGNIFCSWNLCKWDEEELIVSEVGQIVQIIQILKSVQIQIICK